MSTVCVTGGSGFIGSWLVKSLLHRGYNVKATVRDLNDPRETHHLLSLDGAEERLELLKADLLEEGSFDAAVAACDAVFHSASPNFPHSSNPQEDLIDPAVKGTLNVLGSVAKTPSVKRVILTSSEAAMAYAPQIDEQTVIDETWWSDPDYCRHNQLWYVLSKRLAEPTAWEFAKEKGIDLVSINPGCVVGPMLQPTLNTSCAVVLNLINGSETYPNATYGWVHVKDVAEAHVLAMEKGEASGRYYVAERCAHQSEVVTLLRQLYPTLKLPQRCAEEKPFAPVYKVNNEKARKLGVVFTSLQQALKDNVESLKEKGFLKGT